MGNWCAVVWCGRDLWVEVVHSNLPCFALYRKTTPNKQRAPKPYNQCVKKMKKSLSSNGSHGQPVVTGYWMRPRPSRWLLPPSRCLECIILNWNQSFTHIEHHVGAVGREGLWPKFQSHPWIFTSILVDSSPRCLFTSASNQIPVYTAPTCGTETIRYVTP